VSSTTSKSFPTLISLLATISRVLDIWTSPSSKPFLGITVHFIDKDWEVRDCLLDFIAFKGSHTGEKMGETLISVLEEFGIENKILTVTVDNKSNNDTMVAYLLNKGILKDAECHIRCFAHVLNLAVKDALVEVPSISNLRNVVKAIHVSPKLLSLFKSMCGNASVKFLKPTLDVATRWNSTFKMIEIGGSFTKNPEYAPMMIVIERSVKKKAKIQTLLGFLILYHLASVA
jgi:hypothetical protein